MNAWSEAVLQFNPFFANVRHVREDSKWSRSDRSPFSAVSLEDCIFGHEEKAQPLKGQHVVMPESRKALESDDGADVGFAHGGLS